MAGDVFRPGRMTIVLSFEIKKRAICLDLADKLLLMVEASVAKMAVNEHIMTVLSGPIKQLGLHAQQHGEFLNQVGLQAANH